MGSYSSLFFFILATTSCFSVSQPLCHDSERSSLLQFKESFTIEKFASTDSFAYPKTDSWTEEGEPSDCCFWDGVQCHEDTGCVISLDLSSSFLYGPLGSNSSLFSLVHLERLNLADNHFNYSRIPPSIKHLVNLAYLNLSAARFWGQIPHEISSLSHLSSLDLSLNVDGDSGEKLLELKNPSFHSLIQNLTSLKQLDLGYVDISSEVPDSLSSFSLLESLILMACRLKGWFPVKIFQLPRLQILNLQHNQDLSGHLPSLEHSSSLRVLTLTGTSFSGELPSSIEYLHSLNIFDANDCNFSGVIPYSIGKLRHLYYLDLFRNNFRGQIPSSFANLTRLEYLSLSKNDFDSGNLSWVGSLTRLTNLSVWASNLSGPLPSSLGNLTQLVKLKLKRNHLSGPIPPSFARLVNLEILALSDNNLSGEVNFDMFLSLRNLTDLSLYNSGLSVITKPSINKTLPQFVSLLLGWCNITEFPDFLRHQTRLEYLYLNYNQIGGRVPKWMWNVSTETLVSLNLKGNFFTGFQNLPPVLPWINLQILMISSNLITGPLPIPQPSTIMYDAASNAFTGEVSSLVCRLDYIVFIDWSNNRLSGKLPQCLGNFSFSLSFLSLRENLFSGSIPQTFTRESQLIAIDLSHNQLEGQLPRSLADCRMLEYLSLENNKLNDVFPYWLGTLPKLRILVLRSNGFHGQIRKQQQESTHFPNLRIIDLSYNSFNGSLPSQYFRSWEAMQASTTERQAKYSNASRISQNWLLAYPFTITIEIKGLKRYYAAINEDLSIMDLSNNLFIGEIPDTIGILKGLRSLDLSNNSLSGPIPSSLESLTNLESLDLSQNKLSGNIPQVLTKLSFLQHFNVSHNRLTGPIPQANQLGTFPSTSYEGNLGLCGIPLPNKCGLPEASEPLPPSFEEEQEDSWSPFQFGWKVVAIGYGCGFVVGLLAGKVVIARRPRWFAMTFRVKNFRSIKRKRGAGQRC